MAEEESKALVEQVADLNRYGRTLNQCDGVDQVASMTLEALSLLFSFDRVAFVAVEEGEGTVLDSTTPDHGDEPSVAARRAIEAGEVVTLSGEAAGPPGGDATATLAVPGRVVDEVVAVITVHASDAGTFGDDHVEPLRVLTSHVATAIWNIRTRERLEAQKRQLERQNERLDQFASVVSHDLRSPLTLAQGQIDLANERGDDEHFETAHDALDRMNDLIEEILTMARKGKTVTETEPVDVADVAERTWMHMETADATLETDLSLTVEADEERLFHVFENLFRNATDHGNDSVTLTVGPTDDGFYVADDGPGIPPEEREDVFEQAFTTHEEGTGFGLAIVREIVEAHGWSIEVTESEDGGARFEITVASGGVGE